ncbi:hypothetical protein EPO05_06430 [Patescibacteria group bacterium]|nr:MAG: hypothetical protein EPO05_06430 [Patescibacteria group bacterium]
MTDTPTPGETVVTDASKTTVTPALTPAPAPVTVADNGEAEKLRKELEQAKMRENQLANQLKSKEEAEAKAKEAELAEQNQYKELFEQEKAKREALESEQTQAEKQAELEKAKAEALSGYSNDVKEAAEEMDINLTDTDEASVSKYKEKLEKLSARVTGETKVTPNNPGNPTQKTELTTEQLREGLGNEDSFHEIVTKRFPGIAAMTSPKRSA